MEKSITEQFCKDILHLNLPRRRALANMVMGLCSAPDATSVVSVSESRHFHYTHSNIGKVVEDLSGGSAGLSGATTEIQSLLFRHVPPPRLSGSLSYYVLQTDVTKVVKPHSNTLEGRQYVPIANQKVPGNKAIDIGCRISVTHLHAGPGWPLPLEATLLGVEDDAIEVAVAQAKSLLADERLPLSGHLCVQEADSSYGQAAFLSPLHALGNLVCIVRMRAGMRVWLAAEQGGSGGAPRIYGEKYYLNERTRSKSYSQSPSPKHPNGIDTMVEQRSIMDLAPDDEQERELTLSNGRRVRLGLRRWNNVMIRSKKGHNMKDKPFDLVRAQMHDLDTAEPIFDRPLFIGVSGQRKAETTTPFIQERYRERYDVEPYYHFLKFKLLLQGFQTAIRGHLQNYLLVTGMATWLLFLSRNEATIQYKPWQKQLPKNKEAEAKEKPSLSIAQARMAAANLFDTFDPTPFLPPYYKKGKGRLKGTKLVKRPAQPVLKKTKKPPKTVIRV